MAPLDQVKISGRKISGFFISYSISGTIIQKLKILSRIAKKKLLETQFSQEKS